MIKKFVERFDAKREDLRAAFAVSQPRDYDAIVDAVVEAISDKGGYAEPDPKRITRIDHGDYQGTVVYVIGATGYQPSTYWGVKVGYGSCSGCDTLQAIHDCHWSEDGKPTDEQLRQYMELALHVVQGLTEIGGEA